MMSVIGMVRDRDALTVGDMTVGDTQFFDARSHRCQV